MPTNLSWKLRLGIVASCLWLILVYAISEKHEKIEAFLAIGILPLGLIWGTIWTLQGVLEQRRKRQSAEDSGKNSLAESPKKLNLRYVALTLAIAVGAFFINSYYAGDKGAEYTGSFFAYSLGAYFVARNISHTKIHAAAIAIVLFAGGSTIASFNYYISEQKAIADWSRAAPFLTSMANGKPVSEEEIRQAGLGSVEPVVLAFAASMSEFAKMTATFDSEVQKLNLGKLAAPTTLGTDNGRQMLRANTARFGDVITRFERESDVVFKKLVENVTPTIKKLPRDQQRSFSEGFDIAVLERSRDFKKIAKTQRELQSTLSALSALVDQTKPVYRPGAPGQNLLFKSESEIVRYNKIVDEIKRIASEESAMYAQMDADTASRTKKFYETLKSATR